MSVDPVYVRFEGDEAAYLKQAQNQRAQARSATGVSKTAAPVWVGLANEAGYRTRVNWYSPTTNWTPQRAPSAPAPGFPNRDRLFTPGLFARVKLGEGASHPAVLIEDNAVGTDQTRRFVYVVGADSKVEYREIGLGPLFDGLRVVDHGLDAGERIVVNGLQRVRPGATINPQQVAMRLPTMMRRQQLLANAKP